MKLAQEVLSIIEARVRMLDWFKGLAPSHEYLNPIFKVVKLNGKDTMVIAFNTGLHKGVKAIVSVQLAQAVAGLDKKGQLEVLDYNGWLPLNKQVTFSGPVIVSDHNGSVRFKGSV